TVICPDAPVKLFVTATPEARAERRYQELQARGADTIKPRVLAEMAERDRRDSERAAAPLKAAPDAFHLDTSDMDADAAFAAASAEFAALLDESLGGSASFEGSVVKGTVIRIANDFVTVDVGLKSEGRVALREFANGGTAAPEIKEGDIVDIFVDRMENKEGEAVLSRDKARREEAWTVLEKAFTDQERVMGTIFGRVKGGFTVDLSGAVAF